jgi:NADH dehydrogenase [ubiquinone] 1 alpha subcomplex assembly factor 6
LSISDPVLSCADVVRGADYDRYLSVLFARQEARAALFALYAFNYEVAKTAEAVSEPTLGLIRLQWWREAIAGIYDQTPRRHEVVLALSTAIHAFNLPRNLFDALIDAREQDLNPTPFSNPIALENYADATSGHLMRLAARILGAGNDFDGTARSIGAAYALNGLLRAFPHHAARRRIMLPLDELRAAGVSVEEVFSGRAKNVRVLMDGVMARIDAYLSAFSKSKISRRVLPAFLPATLIQPYLRVMGRRDFDPYRDPVELSVPRKQFAMLGAMLRGKI